MYSTRTDIPLEKFTITAETYPNRLVNLTVYIHKDGSVNLNGRLVSEINRERILLSFTEDYRYLCIQIDLEHPKLRRLPKSGTLKNTGIPEALEKSGISLPVQYDCWHSVTLECWQGSLVENPIKRPVGKHPVSQKK